MCHGGVSSHTEAPRNFVAPPCWPPLPCLPPSLPPLLGGTAWRAAWSGRSGPAPPRLSGGGACQVAGVAWCCRLGLGGPGVCAAVVSPRTRKFSGTLWPHCAGPRRPVCCQRCSFFLLAPPGVRRVASLVVWSPPSPFLSAACRRCGTDGRRLAGLRWCEPGNSPPWPPSLVLGRAVSQLNATQQK